MVRRYRDYKGFLLVPVGMRTCNLFGYMPGSVLPVRLGDMSGGQHDKSEARVLTATSGYACNALT